MRRTAALVGLVVLVISVFAVPRPAGAAARVSRVFVFSVPGLQYSHIDRIGMPNLSAFLDRAAIGDLSNRVDGMETSIADAYSTLGAGTRTLGARTESGWAFDPDESVGSETAGAEYTRRTGVPPDGQLVYLAQPALEKANRRASFGTRIGALGDALAAAGHSRSVIANADGGAAVYERTAQVGFADATGRVPGGTVSSELLVADPRAAFGVRLGVDVTASAFAGAWQTGGVVLVEASDLRRAARAGDDPLLMQHARMTSDELFGRLLSQVDVSRDAVLVVGPRGAASGLGLTVAALQTPTTRPGYLQSATTRRAGFVQLVDVAPTVLTLLGVEVPDSMEGRAFTAVADEASASTRRRALADANDAAQFRDRIIGPVTALWVIGQVLLCAAAVFAFARPSGRRVQPVLAPAALVLLAVPLALWLAGPMHFDHAAPYAAFVVAVAAAVAALALVAGRANPYDPVIAVLAATVLLLVVDVMTGAHLQFNTAFGYSPTIAGRFAGIGNLAYSVLGAAALFLAGLLAHRIPGRRGRVVAAIVLFSVCLVDGLPFFGADVGGMLSLVPASAVTLWLLAGKRIRPRTVLIGVATTVAVVLIVGFLDLSRPSARRTHLGRLFERVSDQGWDGLWVVLRRKAEANLGVLGLSIWTLLIPVLFILLGVLLYRSPGRLRVVKRAIPELRAVLVGFGVLAVLGFALNDSGIAIPGVMLGVANAVLVFLSVRTPEPAVASPPEVELVG